MDVYFNAKAWKGLKVFFDYYRHSLYCVFT